MPQNIDHFLSREAHGDRRAKDRTAAATNDHIKRDILLFQHLKNTDGGGTFQPT